MRLALCATAALVTLQGLYEEVSHAAPQTPPPPADDSAWLRRDLFESCLGERFFLRTPSTTLTVQLVRVTDPNGRRAEVANEDNFVVHFRGPRKPKLAQGTYQVDNRRLGRFELFLVPGLTTASGTTYTATFNRLP